MLKRQFVVTMAAALLVAGCAAPVVRTPALDQTVKSVAVVSLLDEKTSIDRIGLTVFNNKSVVIDQSGVLNKLAADTVEAELRGARPGWALKDARGEFAALQAKKRAAGTSWSSSISAISSDLADLAKRLDVDMMFVIVDTSFDNLIGRGVGMSFRAFTASSVKNVDVHALVLVALVDRQGHEITNRWGGRDAAVALVPAQDIGVDYEMTAAATPEGQARYRSLLQDRLKTALRTAVKSAGY